MIRRLIRHKSPKPLLPRRPRLVPRGDGFEIVRIGFRRFWFSDLYARLLAVSWGWLILIIAALYFLSNLAFADFYYLNESSIENTRPGSFSDVFFFSVQTMATIGYGRMVPIGFWPNAIVTVEALWGFTFFAFVTGLSFSKFSRPTARVLFSDIAVISDYEGEPHLKIRLANQRANRIVNANVSIVLLRSSVTKEGIRMRRFEDLKLVRDHVPLLQLTWTIMHPIDKASPLYDATPESLRATEDEIIVSLSGHDETLYQTIHARRSYVADEIVCDAFFDDVLKRNDDGTLEVNYNLFHSYHSAEETGKARG